MPNNIILSPHLDDAVFDCWYLVSKTDSIIVNFFCGIPPKGTKALWDIVSGHANSHELAKKRVKENEEAVALSGNSNKQVFIDLIDFQYRLKSASPSISELADTVQKLGSKDSHYFAPLAISHVFKHPDHIVIRKVGLELKSRGYQVSFFPDLPYMHLPKNKSERSIKNIQKRAEKILGIDLEPKINILDKQLLKSKAHALKLYKTQYQPINIETLGEMSRIGNRNYELILNSV